MVLRGGEVVTPRGTVHADVVIEGEAILDVADPGGRARLPADRGHRRDGTARPPRPHRHVTPTSASPATSTRRTSPTARAQRPPAGTRRSSACPTSRRPTTTVERYRAVLARYAAASHRRLQPPPGPDRPRPRSQAWRRPARRLQGVPDLRRRSRLPARAGARHPRRRRSSRRWRRSPHRPAAPRPPPRPVADAAPSRRRTSRVASVTSGPTPAPYASHEGIVWDYGVGPGRSGWREAAGVRLHLLHIKTIRG